MSPRLSSPLGPELRVSRRPMFLGRWLDRLFRGPLRRKDSTPRDIRYLVDALKPLGKWTMGTYCSIVSSFLMSLHSLTQRFTLTVSDLLCFIGLLTGKDQDIATFKSACLVPMSLINDNWDGSKFFLGGRSWRWFKRWLQRKSASRYSLAQTVLQLKRCSLRVPDQFKDSCIKKYLQSVQKPSRLNVHKYMTFVESATRSIVRLRDGSYRQFDTMPRELDWTWIPKDQVQSVSTRACIERSVLLGGQYGEAIDRLNDEYDEQSTTVGSGFVVVEQGLGKKPLSDFYEHISAREWFLRRPTAICEPLKVRMITVHHWEESAFWSGYQLQASNHHRRFDTFASGKEINEAWLARLHSDLIRCERYHSDFTDWVLVSDDASAATDSIDPWLSAMVSGLHLPSDFRKVNRRSWGCDGDVLVATNKRMNKFIKLRTGQLMGDRRSFETLQEIHFLCKKAFLEKVGLYFPGYPIRINGDDGVIYLPRKFVDAYFSFVEDSLWDLNRTKTHVSHMYFSFNSVSYLRNAVGFLTVPFDRWNLIRRIDKFGNKVKDPRVWNEVFSSASPVSRGMLWRQFCSHWKKDLHLLTFGGNNYYLPELAGGLGLIPLGEFRITPQQWHAVSQVNLWERPPYFSTRVWNPSILRLRNQRKVFGGSHCIYPSSIESSSPPYSGASKITVWEQTTIVTRFLPNGYGRPDPDKLSEMYSWVSGLWSQVRELDRLPLLQSIRGLEPRGIINVSHFGL